MNITLLGTGTPEPSLTRQSSGYLFQVGTDLIALDHGPGAHQRLLESGYRAVDVTHAFFSHLHYDHCLDYARLVLQRWDQGADRIGELEVYGPTPIARMSDLLFADDGVFGPDIHARREHLSSINVLQSRGGEPPRSRPAPIVREVHAGDVISRNTWQITVGHAAHVQPYLECLAFRLDCEDGSVCYSGDSGPCDEIIELARNCDVLIHMNHYFSGTEPSPAYRAACGNHLDNALLAQSAGVRTLILTHITSALDQHGVRERILHETAEVFDGTVIWGEDLMQIPLENRQVARLGGTAARVGAAGNG